MVKKKKIKAENSSILRRDFEVFAKGVERLEEIRMELENLNTKGFEDEEKSIRSKLKNVSYIPEIEEELRILKAKINGSYTEKIHTNSDEKIKKRIKKFEEEIKRLNGIKLKNNLSQKEIQQVRKIPEIQAQLNKLKKAFEEKEKEELTKKEIMKKIDPEIDFMIDNKFNLSLNEIKAYLAKRVEDKEMIIHKQLQDDLRARKENFENQYKELENKFEQDYSKKVRDSLDVEVKRKFKKLIEERMKVLAADLRKKAEEELRIKKMTLKEREDEKYKKLVKNEKEEEKLVNKEIQKKKLLDASQRHLEVLERKVKKELEEKVKQLDEEFKEKLSNEKINLKKHFQEQILINRVNLANRMNEHLTREIKKIHREHVEQLKLDESKLSVEKNKLMKEKESVSKMKSKLNRGIAGLEKYKENFRNNLLETLEKEKDEKIKKAMKVQSKKIKKQLMNEFNSRLQSEIKSKQAEFEKKKADLTVQIQQKAKQLLE